MLWIVMVQKLCLKQWAYVHAGLIGIVHRFDWAPVQLLVWCLCYFSWSYHTPPLKKRFDLKSCFKTFFFFFFFNRRENKIMEDEKMNGLKKMKILENDRNRIHNFQSVLWYQMMWSSQGNALWSWERDSPCCNEPVKIHWQGMWNEWSHRSCGRLLIYRVIPWIWRTKTDRWLLGYDTPRRAKLINGYTHHDHINGYYTPSTKRKKRITL